MPKLLPVLIFSFFINACNASEVSPPSQTNTLSATYTENIQLTLEVSSFNAKAHKLDYCGDYLCLIDGQPFFGSDGKIPKEQLNSLNIKIKQHSLALDTSGMFDMVLRQEDIKDRIQVTHTWGDAYKVRGRFSDGAGGYIVEWLVLKNGSIRTHISDLESLMDLLPQQSNSR